MLLTPEEDANPREAEIYREHPVSYWVEQMTVNYVKAGGGKAERRNGLWDIIWPDGFEIHQVVFSPRDADTHPQAKYITLGDARIRSLVTRLPRFIPGRPVPIVVLRGLPSELHGFWSLWEISLSAADWNQRHIVSCFLQDNGRILPPAAQAIWDELLGACPEPIEHLRGKETEEAFSKAAAAAEMAGKTVFEALSHAYQNRIDEEIEKGQFSFQARREVIERIGLPSVRDHRLAQLATEERDWQETLDIKGKLVPELSPLLLIRVHGAKEDV